MLRQGRYAKSPLIWRGLLFQLDLCPKLVFERLARVRCSELSAGVCPAVSARHCAQIAAHRPLSPSQQQRCCNCTRWWGLQPPCQAYGAIPIRRVLCSSLRTLRIPSVRTRDQLEHLPFQADVDQHIPRYRWNVSRRRSLHVA